MIYDREKMEKLLAELQTRYENVNTELSRSPEGCLVQTLRNGKKNYFQVIGSKNTRKRHGITGNPKLIKALARKKYLETERGILNKDIHYLSKLLETYVDPTANQILDQIPKRYKKLPEAMFFSEPDAISASGWASESYRQNTRNLHEKIHITSKGLRVRSKSELIIADKLDQHHIAYRYDALIYYENHVFSPDFMFMTRDGLMYWEHCGMMSVPKYRASNKWRLNKYEEMGIVPWKNLIITYDMEDGGMNLGAIEAEIKYRLIPAGVLTCS